MTNQQKTTFFLNGSMISLAMIPFFFSLMLLANLFLPQYLFQGSQRELGLSWTLWLAQITGIFLFCFCLIYLCLNSFLILYLQKTWKGQYPNHPQWALDLLWLLILPSVLPATAYLIPGAKLPEFFNYLPRGFLIPMAFLIPAAKKGTKPRFLFVSFAALLLLTEPLLILFKNNRTSELVLLLGCLACLSGFLALPSLHPGNTKKVVRWICILCGGVIPLLTAGLIYYHTYAIVQEWKGIQEQAREAGLMTSGKEVTDSYRNRLKEQNNSAFLRSLQKMSETANQLDETTENEIQCPAYMLTEKLRGERKQYLAGMEQTLGELAFYQDQQTHPFVPEFPENTNLSSLPLSHAVSLRQLSRIYAMRVQEAMERNDKESALADLKRMQKILPTLDSFLIGSLVAIAVETIRVNSIMELAASGRLSPEDLNALEKSLQQDENTLKQCISNGIQTEAAIIPDVADLLLKGQPPDYISIGHANRLLVAPMYYILYHDLVFSMNAYLNLWRKTFHSGKSEWTLESPVPWPKEGDYPKPGMVSGMLMSADSFVIKGMESIARIRAARVGLRYLLDGKLEESIRDPFTEQPYRIQTDSFRKWNPVTKNYDVFKGIMVYSLGANKRDNQGEMRRSEQMDDVAVWMIREKVQTPTSVPKAAEHP